MTIDYDINKAIELVLQNQHANQLKAGETTEPNFIKWVQAQGLELNVHRAKTIKQIVKDYCKKPEELNPIASHFYNKFLGARSGIFKTLLSQTDIARLLGISQQAVNKNIKTIAGYIETDLNFRDRTEQIEQSIYKYYETNTLNFR